MSSIHRAENRLKDVHERLVERYPDFIDRMDRCRAQLKRSVAEYTLAKGTDQCLARWGAMINMLSIYSYEFKALSEEEQSLYLAHRREIIESH